MTPFHSESILCFLTILLLAWQTSGALTCKEDNSPTKGTLAAPKRHPEARGAQELSKGRPSKSDSNTYLLSTVQRTHRIVPPTANRWKPYQVKASESTQHQRIFIPIGESNYRPIEYVDMSKTKTSKSPFPHEFFNKVMSSVANKSSETTAVTSSTNNTVAASSDISEVKVNESGDTDNNYPVRVHPPRFIELESSYVPLNIRFPSRTSKLNIISGENDLVGQDSNQHTSFGRRMSSSESETRSLQLDTRTIFGEPKHEEPLVLKEGGQTAIPNRMQSIIKCIFPDFQFAGQENVKSAC